ncbi:MAG: peptidase S41 [Meiothermus sp.]
MPIRAWLFALVLALSSFSLASPAQDLYNEVNSVLQQRYGGFSQANLSELKQKYQPELDKVCAQDTACPTNKAVPVIQNLIAELGDRHTRYFTPPDYADFQARLRGGNSNRPQIGVQLQTVPGLDGLLINEVTLGSPADMAGLQRWDRILSVDGQPFPPTEDDRVPFLREKVGTGSAVRLQIQRGQTTLEVSVQGQQISLLQLPYLKVRPDGVAVLRIPSFTGYNQVGPRIHDLVREAQAKGAKEMVVDLRGNGGGLLSECLVGAGAFVGDTFRRLKGPNYESEEGYRNGAYFNGAFRSYRVRPATWTGPVNVLVDSKTASCAEYFAFDLQDRLGATVIGRPTAGVGNTATQVLPLSDGSGIQITTAQAQRQDGTPYPDHVTPNVLLTDDFKALAEGRDLLLERAVQLLTADSGAQKP